MVCRFALLLSVLTFLVPAETLYRKPPKAIQDILDAPVTPAISISPARTHALLAEPLRYPPIADLAEPVLRIGGLRISPKTNGPHSPLYYKKLTLKNVDSGAESVIALPVGSKPGNLRWSPDGSRIAFTNTAADRIELWLAEVSTARARRIEGVWLNLAVGGGFGAGPALEWADKGRSLFVRTVTPGRGAPPTGSNVARGPNVQESSGAAGPVRTYQDMLQNPHDEALLDYYGTCQLAIIDVSSGKVTPVGSPGLYLTARLSPDSQHVLTVRVRKPYSYLHPITDFPREVEIWNRAGAMEYKVASLPLADRVPIEGVPTGPRSYRWQPSAAANLLWIEALDEGNPRNKASHRDRLMIFRAPFQGESVEVARMEQRLRGIAISESTSFALLSDYERDRRWTRTFAADLAKPGETPRLLWERNVQDRYKDPGSPVLQDGGNGGVLQIGDHVFLEGNGASPQGDRPFLDRFNIRTGQSERLFHSSGDAYEFFVALLDDNGTKFLTRRETPADPPNYFLRTGGSPAKAITNYTDSAPELRRVEKRLVTYKRHDGVPLSFTLYLPPNYQPGTKLPTIVWAYPLEYNDADTAGQISGSTKRFTTIAGTSHLFFLLEGYAILDGAAMPVIGTPETVNNTYIEQVVADAKAAIDKAVELGVTDPARVGVGGHSYGAFMTANLMAHSDLFRAGIARSGAYNRTLTPFGFQSERRTLWQAPDTYMRMSPFMHADKIKRPILLIHGEADNNTGTFPIQSERMYQAIRGNGGTVRYVTLPFESHGYVARESTEHTLYEMIAWFNKHVKGGGQ
jgi:dipeptidyl aminopeptidase/acylaminoacyl peptidase